MLRFHKNLFAFVSFFSENCFFSSPFAEQSKECKKLLFLPHFPFSDSAFPLLTKKFRENNCLKMRCSIFQPVTIHRNILMRISSMNTLKYKYKAFSNVVSAVISIRSISINFLVLCNCQLKYTARLPISISVRVLWKSTSLKTYPSHTRAQSQLNRYLNLTMWKNVLENG